MLTVMSTRDRLRTTAAWLGRMSFRLCQCLVTPGKAGRFFILTPGLLTTQLLFDRQRKRFIKLRIRDIYDYFVVNQIFLKEDYGFAKLARREDLARAHADIVDAGKTPLILDCGANSGMATRYFSETFPTACVVAVEPVAENIELARSNNSSGNAVFLQAGVACEDSRAHIHDPGLGNWAFKTETDRDGAVEMLSISTICNRFPVERYVPFIAKIDIEGFEANLFSSNCEWIDSFPLVVIELHDWLLPGQGTSNRFLRQVSARNRDFVFYGENAFSIANAPAQTE